MSDHQITHIKTKQSEVYIGNDVFRVLQEFLRIYSSSKLFILVDENTLEHCATELISGVGQLHDAEIIEINSGEENKVLDICYQIWLTLSELKADRNALLINLGGGVICDMGGFVASTYKRGIDFINIPTTLLSQIDASVGGKTGIDFEGLKNMIGVFNEPKGVFIYPPYLKSLDKRQMLSGYAEALKHALIRDRSYWNDLQGDYLSNAANWEQLISRSVNIKNEIVKADPFEKNKRKLLNFGHTIGHAIESYSLDKNELPLLHGEAIAIGMICESYISSRHLGMDETELEEIAQTINSIYKHYPISEGAYHELIALMQHDKKNQNDCINFTLLSAIGQGKIDQEVQTDLIIDALNFYQSLN
ncbi:MAG: 3-dehydroquinate synthase [Flavobacteriales bacterium]|nr:3-dehydroquinate synthase [Flavobacteriales bacterium]